MATDRGRGLLYYCGFPEGVLAWREERKMRTNRGLRGSADDNGDVIRGDSYRINGSHNDGILCRSNAFIGDYYRLQLLKRNTYRTDKDKVEHPLRQRKMRKREANILDWRGPI